MANIVALFVISDIMTIMMLLANLIVVKEEKQIFPKIREKVIQE